MGKSRDDHLRDAERYARQAERWATVSMWGSGCALVLYALGLLLAIVVGVWVFLGAALAVVGRLLATGPAAFLQRLMIEDTIRGIVCTDISPTPVG
jgi:hypothetical protein